MRLTRRPLTLRPRRRAADLPFGSLPSRLAGDGFDLAGLRPYRAGDGLRRVDHRASARRAAATGRDELVVREHLIEGATRVVLVVDRAPSTALFPPELPWLSKPSAVREAAGLLLEAAVEARCAVGLVAAGVEPVARIADGRTPPAVLLDDLAGCGWGPADSLERGLAGLAAQGRRLPRGSLAFVLSDFLAPVPDALWRLLATRLELVPVVVQDPVWEQSFPPVEGVPLPLGDASGARGGLVRLTRREARAAAAANEARLAELLSRFTSLGLDWILLGSHEPADVVFELERWAASRRPRAAVLR